MILRTGDIFTATTNNYTYRYEFIGFELDDPTSCRHIVLRNLDTKETIYVEHLWFDTELTGRKIESIQPITPLLEFLKDEVPYRLNEYLGYDETEVPQEIIDRIIKWVYDRYDFINGEGLAEVIEERYEKECAKL